MSTRYVFLVDFGWKVEMTFFGFFRCQMFKNIYLLIRPLFLMEISVWVIL